MRYLLIFSLIALAFCPETNGKDRKKFPRFIKMGATRKQVEAVYGRHQKVGERAVWSETMVKIYLYAKIFPGLKLGIQVVYNVKGRVAHIVYYKLAPKGKDNPDFTDKEIDRIAKGTVKGFWIKKNDKWIKKEFLKRKWKVPEPDDSGHHWYWNDVYLGGNKTGSIFIGGRSRSWVTVRYLKYPKGKKIEQKDAGSDEPNP